MVKRSKRQKKSDPELPKRTSLEEDGHLGKEEDLDEEMDASDEERDLISQDTDAEDVIDDEMEHSLFHSEKEDDEDTEREEEDEESEDFQGKDDEEEEGQEEEEEGIGAIGSKCAGEEMEELEKEYNNIRNEQHSLLKDLKRHKDDDVLKGQAVKNQKALWNKTLELRFLLQKAFSSSNKLPPETMKSSFCDFDESVNQAYSDLISSSRQTLTSLLELQEALIEKNPSIPSTADEFSHDIEFQNDEEWSQISTILSRLVPFRNSSVDKWHRKTQVASGAAAFKGKFNAFNQNLSDQVAAFMRDPSRMVKRMQLRSSTVGVLGVVEETTGTKMEEDVGADGDPEFIDDSEFYQQLLKEFFESCNLMSSETAFYAMKKLQPKKRKMVDRRASKSRKIRYNVHDKIVNFMAPKKMHLPPMAPKLFENLFGLRNQNPTSVS